MLKATYKRSKLDGMDTFNGVVECWERSFSTEKPLWTQVIKIHRLTMEDAIADASEECRVLHSINLHPATQF